MIRAIKIRLKPTPEQEQLMRRSVGAARFAYNWGLAKWEEIYKSGNMPIKNNIRAEFNQLKKIEEYAWLNEISAQVTQQAFEDLYTACYKFYKGLSGKPRFKSKKKSKPSFYVRYDRIYFKNGIVNIEKVGKVKYNTNYDIPKLPKYNNPRISFDGKYWYLSFGFEHMNQIQELTNKSIGIDLGLKNLAIISNINNPTKNINKSPKVEKLKSKLKRLQRQASRKYEENKQGNKFIKTKNIIKLEKKIKLLNRKINNIRLNHIHQATAMIVKTKPSRVVMEHLNVKGMMKNKYIADSVQEQKFYEFKRQMQYKCEFNGIQFIEADSWYPSSKTCSHCGYIKSKLSLKERTFKCECCGFEIDRDLNAAINLASYKSA